MSESWLLALVTRYPHPTALARRVRDGSVFDAISHLERGGLVRRQRGVYRLTRRGQTELEMARALLRMVFRTPPK